jgi:hypothetical protein
MGFFRIGGFNLLEWGKGNDRFTRTPAGWQIDPDFEFNKHSATWEVTSGREMELYSTTSALQKVIGRHAAMFANGRFVHKVKDGTKEGRVIEDSPLVELLENPNPLQSGEEWLTDVSINYWVHGNCVMLPVYPAGFKDVPYAINNLPFPQIKIITTGKRWKAREINEIIKQYRVCYNTGEDDTYEANEVLHFRRSGGKSAIVGESMLNSAHMEISNIRGAMGYRNVNITRKGALGIYANKTNDSIGGGIPLREEDRISIERQGQEETHGQFEGQSTVKIVNGDVNFIPTSFAIKENMLFEEISEDTKVLIDLVQLNDNIFSKEKSKIQANLLEGLKMGYQDGIFPFAGRFCSLLKKGLNLPDNEWLELDYSHLPCFQEDEAKKSDIDKKQAETIKIYTELGMSIEEAMNLVGVKQS